VEFPRRVVDAPRRVVGETYAIGSLHDASWRLHDASWRLHDASWKLSYDQNRQPYTLAAQSGEMSYSTLKLYEPFAATANAAFFIFKIRPIMS
jgi:hypothetical protein